MAGMSTERLEYLRKANKTSILAHKVVLELFAEIDAIRADLAAAHETFASTPWGTCHTCKAPLTQATAYRCFDCRFQFCEKCCGPHITEMADKLKSAKADLDAARMERDRAREALVALELKFAERAEGQRQWINENAPYISHDQKHLDADTVERAYWHYGYSVALRDVIVQIKSTLTAPADGKEPK